MIDYDMYRELKIKSQILKFHWCCKDHIEVLGFILKMMKSYYAFNFFLNFEIHYTFLKQGTKPHDDIYIFESIIDKLEQDEMISRRR